jgi:hypothetical protein
MKHKHGRKSWGKRGITIFLTLSLMVSLLSTAAYAEGETECEDGKHVWDEGNLVVDEENTCKTNMVYTCTNCGETTKELNSTNHVWDEGNLVVDEENSCKTNMVYTCTNCGETTKVLDSTTHVYDEWSLVVDEENSCFTNIVYTCTNCGETIEELYSTNHVWDENSGVEVPGEGSGCITYIVYQCLNCDNLNYVKKSENHSWDEGVKTEDGCKTTVTYTCTVCDATKEDESYDHEWITYPCSTGLVNPVCKNGDAVSEEQVYTVAKVAHTAGEWQWVDENHELCASSWQILDCSVCGQRMGSRLVESDVAHSWSDWVVTEEATACSTGERYRKCTVCNDAWDWDAIPATGNGEHTWGAWEVTQEATACGEGTRLRKCTVCDAWDWETIPATGNGEHTWGDWVVTEEATACGIGYRHHICTVCKEYESEEIPATGNGVHTWGAWSVVLPATCASGIQARTCTVCGRRMEQLIPPVTSGHEHVWSDWEMEGNNGCEGGTLTRYCTVAENSIEDSVKEYYDGGYYDVIWAWEDCDDFVAPATEEKTIAGNGTHDWGDWELQDGISCTEDVKYRQCEKCGAYDVVPISATGEHNWSDWETVEATECHDTYQYRYCLNCYTSDQDKTDQEIYHHTSNGTIYVASCITRDYYQANTNCIVCRNDYACDENGNQLFNEDGSIIKFWNDSVYGYNPNNHEGGTKLVNAKAATATENGYTGDLYCLGCDKLIEAGKVIYPVLNGANTVWTPDSNTGLVIRSNAPFSEFEKVLINGKELDEKYYSVSEGSTIITISQEYLSTLKDGDYTIEIVSTYGSATTTFTVKGNDAKAAAKADTKKESTKSNSTAANPKTGDESSLVLWVSSLGISFAALALLTVMNKKRNTGKRVK